MDHVFLAFFLTLLAGLSTGVGSFIAFLCRHTNRKFLSVALGFSAGVMIYVSMIEIFFKAQEALISQMGHRMGSWITVAAFFGGMLVIAIIDKLIPSGENPHEIKKIEDVQAKDPQPKRLMRMGIFTALAIAIHNFPEGLATFVSALQEPSVAIPIVAAIAIHMQPLLIGFQNRIADGIAGGFVHVRILRIAVSVLVGAVRHPCEQAVFAVHHGDIPDHILAAQDHAGVCLYAVVLSDKTINLCFYFHSATSFLL